MAVPPPLPQERPEPPLERKAPPAGRKFPCRHCGAKLDFDPEARGLKCPYCVFTEVIPETDADQKAEVREHDTRRHPAIVAAVTDQISQGLGLPPDRVELLPLGSIPKTSSGKLRREETRQLFLNGQLSVAKRPAWMQIARLSTGSILRGLAKSAAAAFHRSLEILYGLYFGAVFLLALILTSTRVAMINDRRAAGRFTRSALKIVFALVRCPVAVVGKEYVDAPGPKIFAANHAS